MKRLRCIDLANRALLALALCLLPLAAPAQQLLNDMVIAVRNDRAGEVRTLLGRGMDPNSVDANGDPLLVIAAREGSTASVDVLLVAKAAVDAKNRFGDTALMVASLNGRIEIVRKLRAAGAEVNRPGWTPLIYAATGGHAEIVRFLLAQGADVNAVSPSGASALMMAVREGKPAIAELLIERGANVNQKSDAGLTALAYAKQLNDTAMVQRLTKAGARE